MTQPTQPAAPPAFQIHLPRDNNQWLKALIYGPYGVGKTTFGASALKVDTMNRVLFLDAESGEMSLSKLDLDVITINKYSQLARIYEFLRLHCRYRDATDGEEALKRLQTRFRGPLEAGEKAIRYNTVVIDSLTEIQKYVMYQLLSLDFTANISLDVVPDSAEFKEWGQSAEMIRLLVRAFRDLPMHVIFILPEMETEDNGRTIRKPSLPGKLSGEVQGFVDVVGYLRSATNAEGVAQRRLYLTDGAGFKAKHRFRGVEATFLDNPTMQGLLDLRTQAQS